MAIQSAGEFEVTFSSALLSLDRMLNEAPSNAALQQVRRTLGQVHASVHRKEPFTQKQVAALATAAETMRTAGNDPDMPDLLFDLHDYVEQHLPT
jgi:hypothetical protein